MPAARAVIPTVAALAALILSLVVAPVARADVWSPVTGPELDEVGQLLTGFVTARGGSTFDPASLLTLTTGGGHAFAQLQAQGIIAPYPCRSDILDFDANHPDRRSDEIYVWARLATFCPGDPPRTTVDAFVLTRQAGQLFVADFPTAWGSSTAQRLRQTPP